MDKNQLRSLLFSMADGDYAAFSASLMPGVGKVIGVRLPKLRALSRRLAREDYAPLLTPGKYEYFEETMLRGMLIGQINCGVKQRLELIRNFIPQINNWSVCDSFCASLKFTNQNKPLVFEFLRPYLASQKEFEVRFGFVMLTLYYIDHEYLPQIFNAADSMNCHDYYAEMAAAWCLSMAATQNKEAVLNYLKTGRITERVFILTKKKICESRQFDSAYKQQIKNLK